MAISFVGQASAVGTSVPLPAHVAGDLIVIFAYQDAANVAIALASGYTASGSSSAGNSNNARSGYRIATSNAETSGVWDGATEVIAHVYRGVDQVDPLRNPVQTTGVAAVTYGAVNLSVTDGSSWVVAFAGMRVGSQPLETPPPGMTNRSNVANGSTGEVAGHDTAGGVSSWSLQTSSATGFRYRTSVHEIRADPNSGSTGIIGKTSKQLRASSSLGRSKLTLTGKTSKGMRAATVAAASKLRLSAIVSKGLRRSSSSARGVSPNFGRTGGALARAGVQARGKLTVAAIVVKALRRATVTARNETGSNAGRVVRSLRSASVTVRSTAFFKGRATIALRRASASALGDTIDNGRTNNALRKVQLSSNAKLTVSGRATVSLKRAEVSGIGRNPLKAKVLRTLRSVSLAGVGKFAIAGVVAATFKNATAKIKGKILNSELEVPIKWQRKIASATRMIEKNGLVCVWKRAAPIAVDAKPWRDEREGSSLSFRAPMVFFSPSDVGKGSELFAAKIGGTEVAGSTEVALMPSGLEFEPKIGDELYRNNVRLNVIKIDRLAPSGVPLLYYVWIA